MIRLQKIVAFICVCLVTTPFSASAELVNEDWNGGTNNLTRDTETGLRWLDLTESRALTRDHVITQFDSGGDFEGFRYATNAEVITLWSNFGIDLSASAPMSTPGLNPQLPAAAETLGNTFYEYNPVDYPYGTIGVTADEHDLPSFYCMMGSYYYADTHNITYYWHDDDAWASDTTVWYPYSGHYLVSEYAIYAVQV